MNDIDAIDATDFGFDLHFYTIEGLRNFIDAAQSGIDEFTPALRCEDFYEQEIYGRIRDRAGEALGILMPVRIPFESDLMDHVDGLIVPYMLRQEGLSAGCDLREALGFEFD